MKEPNTPPAMLRQNAVSHESRPTASLRSTPAEFNQIKRTLPRFVLAVVLCFTILAVFVPLDPPMPAPGLDMSWMMAMNQAVAQRLVFGRDIIFTFGPYASIYTELYHPATDGLMIWGSLLLGIAYFALLLFLAEDQKPYGLYLYGLFLAGFLNSRDALLFSFPLMMALVVYRMTLPDDQAMKLHLTKPFENSFPLLFAPLGFLPLIKGSLLPLCAVTVALCCAMLWHCGKKATACLAVGGAAISCVLAWVAAHQPLLALPRYFWSMRQIISGYTEAMAFNGDPWEWILYLLGSASILFVVIWAAPGPKISRWFLVACFAFFLFTAFKGGFVRQDRWHNVTAGSAILAAALLLIFVVQERRCFIPLGMAVLVWTYINHRTALTVTDYISRNIRGTFEQAYQGARKRLTDSELRKEYDQHIAAIRAEFPIPPMPGTTDLYPFHLSWLLASENTWSPRPIVQSYSAYTPELAQLNLMHLKGVRAPANIIFNVEPIDDGRLPSLWPSLEDGPSWPALINGYSLMKLDARGAYLRKRAKVEDPVAPIASDLSSGRHEFGEEVSLPESKAPLLAKLDLAPTLLGRIREAVFKPPQLAISVRLRDGRVMQYRALSNMMKSDFLISPLVQSAEEFALLAAGGNRYLAGNQVKSIALSSDDRRGWFWKTEYSLRLRTVDLTKSSEIESSFLFDKMSDAAPASQSPPATLQCEGIIASVNSKSRSAGTTIVENVLSVAGWMGIAAKDGILPDNIFVWVRSASGKTFYVRAHRTRRDDVKRHFNQPGMGDPGYAALIDVSGLKGSYTLGLARTYRGNLGVCEQFQLPLLINP